MDLNNRTRYGGATIDQPSLVIHAAHKQDTGSYSCVLENVVGASESQNAALLDVYCKYKFCVNSLIFGTTFNQYLHAKIFETTHKSTIDITDRKNLNPQSVKV